MSAPIQNELDRMQQMTETLQNWLHDLKEDRIVSQVPDELLQSILAFALRIYAMKLEDNPQLFPFTRENTVTATELLPCVTRFMQAVDVEIFELGMWQAWNHSTLGG